MYTSSQEIVKLAIVDDHKLFRQGLVYILRRFAAYEVVLETASGQELLNELIAGLHIDIVLLDLHMPGMNGKDVSRQLLAQYPHIKIIILSMDYSQDFILDLVSLGIHGYLPKDIDQRLLDQAIKEVGTKGYYIDDTVAQIMRIGLQTKLNSAKTQATATELGSVLTEREKEVLKLLCQGYNSSQIAEQLFISLRTVEGHRKHLLEKTGANNAVSLAVYAIRNQLLDGIMHL